jgi:serine protease Do
MRKSATAVILILILAGAAAGGYFFGKNSGAGIGDQSTVSEFKSQLTTLTDNLNVLQGDMSLIGPLLQNHLDAIARVVSVIQPAVLRINVSSNGAEVLGSGFFVRSDGYAITNNHVIETKGVITATLMTGDVYEAVIVAADTERDLALLKLKGTRTDFPAAVVGMSSATRVGDDVVACGFPLGFDLPGPASFTRGIISAIRTINGFSFVQTDCEVDPGSSGGCVVNMECEVVGVTSDEVLPPTTELRALALAIPSDDLLSFIKANLKQ